MQLYRASQVPATPRAMVFAQSGKLLSAAIVLLALGGLALANLTSECTGTGLCLVAVAGVIALSGRRRLLSRSNWLVCITLDGVLIKFRSLHNAHLPDENPAIVALERSEIRSAARYTERLLLPGGMRSTTAQVRQFLELRLVHSGTQALQAALAFEHKTPYGADGKPIGKVPHYPVSVPEPGVIRICFRSGMDRIRPGLERAIRVLGVPVEPPRHAHLNWAKLGREEALELADGLGEAGDVLTALLILRRRFGCSEQQALRFLYERALGRALACPRCGYDLRATPSRCPECGLHIPTGSAPQVLERILHPPSVS